MSPRGKQGLGLFGSLFLGLISISLTIAPPDRPMVAEAPSFAIGTTSPGECQRHGWTIHNESDAPLTLRTRFTAGRCGFSLWLGEDHVVPVGGQFRVSLTCPTPSSSSTPYSSLAEVSTSDPKTPRLRFRVYGMTGLAPIH